MRSFLRKKLAGLAGCTSGNAAVLVALGMPMLIGGAGLGVDTAQWYMWKRELQYAVDQAAIAGAWEKAKNPTRETFKDRAEQEYEASIELVDAFDSGADVTLEDYDGGTDNSVQVVASATKELPFSSMLTGDATTVAVRAVAIHEPGATYRPCFLALDPDAEHALKLNGNVTVKASCGLGALSTDVEAIVKEGDSGTVEVTFVVTGGGIADEHGHFDEETRLQWMTNLNDPYEELDPPDNPSPQDLPTCASENNKYTADENVSVRTSYAYFTGPKKNNLTPYPSYPSAKPTTTTTPVVTAGLSFNNSPENKEVAGKPDLYEIPGGGNDKIWEEKTQTTITTYTNIVAPSSTQAAALPGTYDSFDVNCDTVLTPGVYVLNGASIKIAAHTKLSGTGVMFVLTNGAGFQVSGQAMIELTAMTRDQLLAAGVHPNQVDRMLGMLIFEDDDSTGSSENQLTGGSTQILNGVVYTPNTGLKIAGNPAGTSQCMVLATRTLQIAGTTDITSMCPTNVQPNAVAAETQDVVRLVA